MRITNSEKKWLAIWANVIALIFLVTIGSTALAQKWQTTAEQAEFAKDQTTVFVGLATLLLEFPRKQ